MSRRAAAEGYELIEAAGAGDGEPGGDAGAPATVPGGPVEVGYLTMATTDTERARQFFGGLFGWQFEAGASGEGYAHIANTRLPMGLTPEGAGEPPTLYFRVGSIAEMTRRLSEAAKLGFQRSLYPSTAAAPKVDGMALMEVRSVADAVDMALGHDERRKTNDE